MLRRIERERTRRAQHAFWRAILEDETGDFKPIQLWTEDAAMFQLAGYDMTPWRSIDPHCWTIDPPRVLIRPGTNAARPHFLSGIWHPATSTFMFGPALRAWVKSNHPKQYFAAAAAAF